MDFGVSYPHNLKKLESALYTVDQRISQAQNVVAQKKVDLAEAQKIVDTPFPQESELEEKAARLETLTDEINKAAIEAKKNAPQREPTYYFERAKLKKESARLARKEGKSKEKSAEKKKTEGIGDN